MWVSETKKEIQNLIVFCNKIMQACSYSLERTICQSCDTFHWGWNCFSSPGTICQPVWTRSREGSSLLDKNRPRSQSASMPKLYCKVHYWPFSVCQSHKMEIYMDLFYYWLDAFESNYISFGIWSIALLLQAKARAFIWHLRKLSHSFERLTEPF